MYVIQNKIDRIISIELKLKNLDVGIEILIINYN